MIWFNKEVKKQIFISYRTSDGKAFAKFLYNHLISLKYSVFLDEESIHSGRFDSAIFEAIDECKDFILVVSPEAIVFEDIKKDWIYKEILYALKKRKNIIPIFEGNQIISSDLPEGIKEITEINGIDLNKEKFLIPKLLELLISKPHVFVDKQQIIESNNDCVKKIRIMIQMFWCFTMVLYILFICVHYTFRESWELPFIIWRLCKAFSKVSIDLIVIIQIVGFMLWKILVHYTKLSTRYCVIKMYGERNFDDIDFNTNPAFFKMKLQTVMPKKYMENEKIIHVTSSGLWKHYIELNGVIIASDRFEEVEYFALDYKMWPRLLVYCIGKQTLKNQAIKLMNEQGIKYNGIKDDVMYFDNDEKDIRIIYGRLFPQLIEVKNKECSYGLENVNIKEQAKTESRSTILEGDDGIDYEVEFLDFIEYKNKRYYVVITIKENEAIGINVPIVLVENETDYAVANSYETEIIFAIFKDRHIDEYEFND